MFIFVCLFVFIVVMNLLMNRDRMEAQGIELGLKSQYHK